MKYRFFTQITCLVLLLATAFSAQAQQSKYLRIAPNKLLLTDTLYIKPADTRDVITANYYLTVHKPYGIADTVCDSTVFRFKHYPAVVMRKWAKLYLLGDLNEDKVNELLYINTPNFGAWQMIGVLSLKNNRWECVANDVVMTNDEDYSYRVKKINKHSFYFVVDDRPSQVPAKKRLIIKI